MQQQMTLQEMELRKAVRNGSQIDAIKVWREWKNVGIREAANHIKTNWSELRLKYCQEGG